MIDRISCYETNVDNLREFLMSSENISEDERTNALVALCAIVSFLQGEIEKLKEDENPYHLKGEELEKAIKERISR